jgi:hypothetical protein
MKMVYSDSGRLVLREVRMSILPPAVLTVTQLVSGLVASAKNAQDLAKASSDRELKSTISELYDSLLDVKACVLDLDEENRNLKAELARKEEIVGPNDPHGYFFYKDNLGKPLCPKCVQSLPRNPVFLSPAKIVNGASYRECPICHWGHYETEPQPLKPIRLAGPSISDIRHRRV